MNLFNINNSKVELKFEEISTKNYIMIIESQKNFYQVI